MTKQKFLELLEKYLTGNTSEAENDILLRVYKRMEDRSNFDIAEIEDLENLEEEMVNRFKMAISQNSLSSHNSNKETFYNLYQRYRLLFNIAACIICITGVAIIYNTFKSQPGTEEMFGKSSTDTLITYDNKTGSKVKIYFADHSNVELEDNSRIIYEKRFTGHQRKVYLFGKGFFNVTKNREKPFIVYTERLVTKVLETSFSVNSNGTDAQASVTVMSGRVAVFKKEEFREENMLPSLSGGLLLTPNHTAALTLKNVFTQKLVDQPNAVKAVKENDFVFDNTPVSEVFDNLQQFYNIKINYNQQKLQNCSLSVNMEHESFFRKLDLICHTLDLNYQSKEGEIFVTGEGCTGDNH